MFSAVKFVAASVIVALFGGFLLAGVLTTQQGDEVAPAAVTDSPSPMTSEELLSGMVTEEVEPFVFRVINDGVRDLGADGRPSTRLLEEAIVVDDDGDVWRLTSVDGEPSSRYFRLGAEDEWSIGPDDPDREWAGVAALAFEVTPDGRLATDESEAARFFEREGGSRTPEELGLDGVSAVEWEEDGTIWLLDHENGLVRAWADGALAVLDWSVVHDGMVAPEGLAVTPEGEAWLMVRAEGVYPQFLDPTEAFLRLDGRDWEAVPAHFEVVPAPDGIASDGPGIAFDVGPEGTLWTAGDAQYPHQRLARYDDSGWTIFGEAHGVGPWGGQRLFVDMPVDMIRVAPDGSAWVNAAGPERLCDGLARFDGATWSSFLSGRCIGDYDFASDGAVWVVAQEQHDPDHPLDELDTQTYVITPEAVSAKEAEVSEPSPAEEATNTEEAATAINELLAGMVTDEVEPGVLRIVDDGVRDPGGAVLAVGEDGSVWGVQGRGLFRLGGEYLDWPEGVHPDDFAAAPDGVLWVVTTVSAGPGGGSIDSFDGNQWTKHRTVPVDGLAGVEIAPDGTVWAWWPEPNDADSTVVARYGADGWKPLATEFPAASHQGRFPMVWDVLVSGTGDVWVWSSEDGQAHAWLSRYVNDEWETSEYPFTTPEVGSDGILRAWPQPQSHQAEDGAPVLDLDRMPPLFDDARPWMQFDGGSWRPFGPDDGVLETLSRSRVAPDGSIWASASGDDSGLSHFDGEAWSHYLPDHVVIHFEFGPDSSVWVTAGSAGQFANYVITPEAVASAE